jgi:hypothetical protein
MKDIIQKFGLIAIITMLLASCQLGPEKGKSTGSKDDGSGAEVKEVLQTSSYTYLRVDKYEEEQWIAVLRGEYNVGDIVYYETGLEMNNFESNELNRTFDKIFFIDVISDKPLDKAMPAGKGMMGNEPQKPVLSKLDIKVDQPEGGVSIAELYANRGQYTGKIVKVKGQVTKVNEGIMGRNWVHLQDGTADGDNFDLTVTTEDLPMVGEVITYSGTFNTDRDFGAGYTYSVILEDAIPVTAH